MKREGIVMDWILTEASAIQEELVSYRRWLHEHAEVGFDLNETKAYVFNALTSMGIEAVECGRSGLVAILGNQNVGKTLLLRADMDALPIPEESGVDFECKNGKMHACGHDLHTAMLLGAAKILKAHESEIPGRVKLMFQPAEEIFEGSRDMIRCGVLKDPKPDAAVMMHVTAATPMPAGVVIICPPGITAPAADYFTIMVQGKGCHGSTPHNGVDALTAASHILLALQEIHARELSSGEDAVLTIGTFQGGTAPNVIADSAVLAGTMRTYSEETRLFLKERLTAISNAIATAYRAEATVTFGSGCPTLVNDKALGTTLNHCLKKDLGANTVLNGADLGSTMRGGGSEDFAYISQEVPSVMLALAAGEPKNGYAYPQHHPKVKFDESVLSRGTAIFVSSVFGYLSDR